MGFYQRKGQFTSKGDAMARAKKVHCCTACLFSSPATFKECPECHVTGMRVYFPSRSEHLRAVALIQMQLHGEISQIKFHPRYDLIVEGRKICAYEADVSYVDRAGKQIIEDTKASGTDFIEPVAELKISLFNALFEKHGLQVKIYRKAQ